MPHDPNTFTQFNADMTRLTAEGKLAVELEPWEWVTVIAHVRQGVKYTGGEAAVTDHATLNKIVGQVAKTDAMKKVLFAEEP